MLADTQEVYSILFYAGLWQVRLDTVCVQMCGYVMSSFRFSNLKTDRKKIHMNLIVALGLAQITHVVGIGLTSDPATCMCIAILLHLLYTATFTWMLCEGIHLYHKVIAVFETEGKGKKILYYIIGWGEYCLYRYICSDNCDANIHCRTFSFE